MLKAFIWFLWQCLTVGGLGITLFVIFRDRDHSTTLLVASYFGGGDDRIMDGIGRRLGQVLDFGLGDRGSGQKRKNDGERRFHHFPPQGVQAE